jgi:hypothetical protein
VSCVLALFHSSPSKGNLSPTFDGLDGIFPTRHRDPAAPSPHHAASGQIIEREESRNWYRDRYEWAVSDFPDHGILMPSESETPTANQDMDATTANDDEIEPLGEPVKRHILYNLVTSAEYVPLARRFSPELCAFSYLAHMCSSSGYGFIRELLPLPAEGTMQTKYQQSISQIQEDLADRA